MKNSCALVAVLLLSLASYSEGQSLRSLVVENHYSYIPSDQARFPTLIAIPQAAGNGHDISWREAWIRHCGRSTGAGYWQWHDSRLSESSCGRFLDRHSAISRVFQWPLVTQRRHFRVIVKYIPELTNFC
jgi:hypothetical protein